MDSFVFVLFVILLIALTLWRRWYNSPEQKGKRGEKEVALLLAQLPEDYSVLNDVVLRTDNGTTQIDHIVVSKYGIFTIETKNYRGNIHGDDNREQWTQIIVTKVTYTRNPWKTCTYVTKNHFYNPVKQSMGHAYRIKEELSQFSYIPVIPITVFVGDAILSNVTSKNIVINVEALLPTIKKYQTAYLKDDETKLVLETIEKRNARQFVKNREHVQHLYYAQQKVDNAVKMGMCPKCGGKLVLRQGRFGKFYGCSNYPNCRFTRQPN